jgi:CheY-like chemotaxis protein
LTGKGRFFLFQKVLSAFKKKKYNSGIRSSEMLPDSARDRKKRYNAKNRLVLVVEDDENIAKLIKSWLEIRGFKVSVACDGSKAIDLLEKFRFCLVTTDILMPEIDGVQLINYIKSNPYTHSIPVIVLSIVDKSDLGNFFADAYIKKPFDGFDLLKVVDELM